MELQDALIHQLSSKGILAYVAVAQAGDGTASTATLAGLVKAQTSAVLEGLKELSTVCPQVVGQGGRGKWRCGKGGEGLVVQNLDSQRYPLLVDDLQKYWQFLNPAVPFSISGADGAAIRQFLRDKPGWNQEHWLEALRHRARSVVQYGKGSRTESFYTWIRRLGDYAAGPINEYGNSAEGSGNARKAIAVVQGNRAAREAFLANQNR